MHSPSIVFLFEHTVYLYDYLKEVNDSEFCSNLAIVKTVLRHKELDSQSLFIRIQELYKCYTKLLCSFY